MTGKSKRKLRWIIPIAVIALLVCAFLVYVEQYYHADARADAAMVSDANVQIIQTDSGWLFNGKSETDALVFYPGGKVEATAYAPLCRALAERGVDVCLVEMPFRLAVFGKNKADPIIDSMDYEHWFIGGHSLGGAMAAAYAADHPDKVDGIIMLAAFSIDKLDDSLVTLIIYGSEDGVLDMEKFQENLDNVPETAITHVIEGGNHSQFGSYGVQSGDGAAQITQEQQVEETALAISEIILGAN